VAFALVGSHAFDQVNRASNSVALASAWHLLDALLGVNRQRWVIRLCSTLLLVALVWLLAERFPVISSRSIRSSSRSVRSSRPVAPLSAWWRRAD